MTLAAPAAASLRKWISPCYVIHYYGNIRYLAFLQQIYRKTHAGRRLGGGRFEALALNDLVFRNVSSGWNTAWWEARLRACSAPHHEVWLRSLVP